MTFAEYEAQYTDPVTGQPMTFEQRQTARRQADELQRQAQERARRASESPKSNSQTVLEALERQREVHQNAAEWATTSAARDQALARVRHYDRVVAEQRAKLQAEQRSEVYAATPAVKTMRDYAATLTPQTVAARWPNLVVDDEINGRLEYLRALAAQEADDVRQATETFWQEVDALSTLGYQAEDAKAAELETERNRLDAEHAKQRLLVAQREQEHAQIKENLNG